MNRNKKLRLLLVDDDAVMRELLSALLDVEGDEVIAVETPEDAIRILTEEKTLDAVLTDLHLPEIETETLISQLREHSADIPLLGISASAPEGNLRLRLDGFLMKPFGAEQVHEAVRQAKRPSEAVPTRPESPHAGPGTPVLDLETYAKFAASLPAGQVGELYRFTLADVEKRLTAIGLAAERGDFESCRSEAHAIKGGCGMVGALELRSLAATMETGATADTLTLAEMNEACDRLRRMLDTLT